MQISWREVTPMRAWTDEELGSIGEANPHAVTIRLIPRSTG
jgi:hypothetical protein